MAPLELRKTYRFYLGVSLLHSEHGWFLLQIIHSAVLHLCRPLSFVLYIENLKLERSS